jgi:hypothetical protein
MWDEKKSSRFQELRRYEEEHRLSEAEQIELTHLISDLDEVEAAYLSPATQRLRENRKTLEQQCEWLPEDYRWRRAYLRYFRS